MHFERNFDSAGKLNNVTSYYVIASSKLCPEVGDDYTALCNFLKAIERGGGGALEPPQPVTGSERKLGLNSKCLISLAQATVY